MVQIEGHEQLRDATDRAHDGECQRRREHARMARRRDRHRPHRAGAGGDGPRRRGLASERHGCDPGGAPDDQKRRGQAEPLGRETAEPGTRREPRGRTRGDGPKRRVPGAVT